MSGPFNKLNQLTEQVRIPPYFAWNRSDYQPTTATAYWKHSRIVINNQNRRTLLCSVLLLNQKFAEKIKSEFWRPKEVVRKKLSQNRNEENLKKLSPRGRTWGRTRRSRGSTTGGGTGNRGRSEREATCGKRERVKRELLWKGNC